MLQTLFLNSTAWDNSHVGQIDHELDDLHPNLSLGDVGQDS